MAELLPDVLVQEFVPRSPVDTARSELVPSILMFAPPVMQLPPPALGSHKAMTAKFCGNLPAVAHAITGESLENATRERKCSAVRWTRTKTTPGPLVWPGYGQFEEQPTLA